MKLILASAAAAALIFAAPSAFAADHHGHDGNHAEHNNKSSDAKPAANKAAPVSKYGQGKPAMEVYREGQAAKAAKAKKDSPYGKGTSPQEVYRKGHSPYGKGTPANEVYRQGHSAYGNGKSPQQVYREGHRNDRNHNWSNNFNRRNVEARHHYRYRGGSWRWPHGYSYRRWSFGMTLPSLFWSNDYWINDYSYYGLAYPPPGTVWVRYGSDAILIDRYSGEILEVVYGQFY